MADLKVKIAGTEFSNPILAASGTFGYGVEFSDFFDLDLIGGFVTKGISLEPKAGNPPPRIAETPSGMLNAIGLENIGLKRFLSDKLPLASSTSAQVVVNIYGTTIEQYAAIAEQLDETEGIAAIELNISCPNVKKGGLAFGAKAETAAELTAEVRKVTKLPLWVKLTPNVGSPAEIARAVEAAGADAVSLINTITAMAVDLERRRPILGNITGGLSGPAIKPIALRMVFETARAVKIPVIGIGGITTARDAAEFILVGASAVQIGAANFVDPALIASIPGELSNLLDRLGYSEIEQLKGAISFG